MLRIACEDQNFTLEELLKMNVGVPRYTSYPTANVWGSIDIADYHQNLHELKLAKAPISLYIHIPFCHRMCLYCACSVVLNRKEDKQQKYVDYLVKEISLFKKKLDYRPEVGQVHFGGGTPTALTLEQFEQIFKALSEVFSINYSQEVSIEIDPRTVVDDQGKKLKQLKALGFNRVSFGVQDLNWEVQKAVKRYQSEAMTRTTFSLARELGFEEVNVDLIYGLPKQSLRSFEETVEKIQGLKPDRISLFSYAKVPWLKSHQQAIKENELPSTEEKFQIYFMASQKFTQSGYVAIGMDHFSLESTPLAKAFRNKSLQRNFQGYFTKASPHLLGLGYSSIGELRGNFFQNIKNLDAYYEAIDDKRLPVERGYLLSDDDRRRKWVIGQLMCNFELSFLEFESRFALSFTEYFSEELDKIREFEKESYLTLDLLGITVTSRGSLFIRNIASVFDYYYQTQKRVGETFSKGV